MNNIKIFFDDFNLAEKVLSYMREIIKNCGRVTYGDIKGLIDPYTDHFVLSDADFKCNVSDYWESSENIYILFSDNSINLSKPKKCTDNEINDGGERISYGEGKAIREPSNGKGRYDLISPFALERIARWYELGAIKYSDRNWEKGMPYSRYVDSAMRHLIKFMMGMDDEDHLVASCWNLMAIMHHQGLFQGDELDDLPHYLSPIKPSDINKED